MLNKDEGISRAELEEFCSAIKKHIETIELQVIRNIKLTLETIHEPCCLSSKHLIEHAQEGVEKCFERIESLEGHLKQYHELMLGTCPIELEKTIRANMHGKIPHKCPVCEGMGGFLSTEPNTCHACEGKGIVWG